MNTNPKANTSRPDIPDQMLAKWQEGRRCWSAGKIRFAKGVVGEIKNRLNPRGNFLKRKLLFVDTA